MYYGYECSFIYHVYRGYLPFMYCMCMYVCIVSDSVCMVFIYMYFEKIGHIPFLHSTLYIIHMYNTYYVLYICIIMFEGSSAKKVQVHIMC